LGDLDVGGVEIIGYDPESGKYTSHFFDSQGHITVDELLYKDGEVDLEGRADPHHLDLQRRWKGAALAA
jgi:hypothetical protein